MTAATARSPTVRVRDARPQDVPCVQAIYAHHVRHGLASFEETPPDVAEIERRFQATLALSLPYLAAEIAAPGAEASLAGYAYAGRYRSRPGYRYSIENSVYIDPACVGQGIGRMLLTELIDRCTALGYRQMIAVIGDSDNAASIRLHRSLGFADAGTIRSVGFKFGRWVDSVILQRPLGPGDSTVPTAKPTGWQD